MCPGFLPQQTHKLDSYLRSCSRSHSGWTESAPEPGSRDTDGTGPTGTVHDGAARASPPMLTFHLRESPDFKLASVPGAIHLE